MTESGTALYPRAGRALLTGVALTYAVSVVAVNVAYPDGTPMSADPGSPRVTWWVASLPHLAGVALALALPWRSRPLQVRPDRASPLHRTTVVLLALSVLFPLLVGVLGSNDVSYLVLKLVLLIALPAAVVGALRGAIRIEARPGAWRWWAPGVVLVVWVVLSEIAPWNAVYDPGYIDPVHLFVAAILTALTAGVGEELFYRRWLQSRLEAMFGAWPGIAVASLMFALLHLGSHGTGEPLLDVARVIAGQGSFGLFAGVLWWRYRNLAAIIAAHVITNGWGVAAYLLAG